MSNANIKDGLGYSGKVTLKTYSTKTKKIIKEKVIKNTGTVNLFKFLCSCLIQQYESSGAPKYLGAAVSEITYTENSISNIATPVSALSYKSKLSNTQLIQSEVATEEADITGFNWHAVFTGTILYGQLRSAETPIRSFQLYATASSQELSTPLAYINLTEDLYLRAGEALIVEWDMSFNNWTLRG